MRTGSHVHEAHDHCRTAPGNAEDFHAVSDDVEQCFQVGQVVDTYCTSGIYTLDYRGIVALWSDCTVGGTLQSRSCCLSTLGCLRACYGTGFSLGTSSTTGVESI